MAAFPLGREQFVEGVRYYSQDAMHNSDLMLDDSPRSNNPFHPEITSLRPTWTDFRKPRPWSTTFGWISFIPSRELYKESVHPVFEVLACIPPPMRYRDSDGMVKGYALSKLNGWKQLDEDLYNAVTTLKHAFNIPMTLPFRPWSFGYDKVYHSKSLLRLKAQLSREWFLVWFGALSYCLAWKNAPSDSMYSHDAPKYPQWRSVLQDKGLRPDWMDDIENSPITFFHHSNPRAGTILDVLNPSRGQPSLQWLKLHGIETWYRWSTAEEDANWNKSLDLWRPPSRQACLVLSESTAETTAFDTPNSSRDPDGAFEGINDTRIADTPLPSAQHDREQDDVEACRSTWRDEFFRKMKEKNELILESESVSSRNTRLNWEREPPTMKAKVFEWFPDDENPRIYKLHPVPNRAKQDTLFSSYGINQRIYDSFSNTWHCCSDFGEDDEDGDDIADDFMGRAVSQHDPAVPDDEVAALSTSLPSTDPTATLVEMDSIADIEAPKQDSAQTSGLGWAVIETLAKCYGLCWPAPGIVLPRVSNFSEREQSLCLRLTCRHESPTSVQHFQKSDEYVLCLAFHKSINDDTDASTPLWDLSANSLRPVFLSKKFQALRMVAIPDCVDDLKESYSKTKVYYLFDLPHSPIPWSFATLSATAALIVCRFPADAHPGDIAFYFAQRGIPFRVFYPRRCLTTPPPAFDIPHTRPRRLFGHRFTKADYEGYVRQRVMLLGQSHMQAAIKRGGIAWRLAIGVMGLGNVCGPPSLWGSYSRIQFRDEWHCDDLLTTVELDILCGVYECIDDMGGKKLVSWWPLPRYYEKEECGENYGFWNLDRETWYRSRLQAIEDGGAQPKAYNEWKSELHGQGAIRKFHAKIEAAAKALLE